MERVNTGFRLGKNKVEVLKVIGELRHYGRVYRLVRVRVSTGEQYFSLRLYNARGKFIKQFMVETEVSPAVGALMGGDLTDKMQEALYEAELKAFESLANYKFQMFGYWAAIWVHLNRILAAKRPNPFKELVGRAKKEVGSEKVIKRYPCLFRRESSPTAEGNHTGSSK